MSDFLSRLVGRAMGRTPVVRPRLASLYEAGPAVSGAPESGFGEPRAPDDSPRLESTEETAADAPSPRRSRDEAPGADPEASAVPRRPGDADAAVAGPSVSERPRHDAPSRVAVRASKPAATEPPSDASRPSPTETPDPPEAGARSRRPARPTPAGRVTPQDVRESRPPRPVREGAGPPAETADRPEALAVPSPTRRAPAEGPTPRRPDATPAAPSVGNSDEVADRRLRPAVTAVPEGRAERAPAIDGDFRRAADRPATPRAETRKRATSPPAREPTIQVTIGRIEVRAVTPPAQPAKPKKPTAPRLSLDDYLRRRDEERR